MEILIIIGLVIIYIVFYGFSNGKVDMNYNPYVDHNFKMGVYRTILKGTQYRGLTSFDLGSFHGKAKAKTDNPYDKYAVGIYNKCGKHLGYAPKGYMTLHQSILDRGGSVYCSGILRSGDINQNVILGDIYIDFDPNYWGIKMKESGKRNTYKSPNFKKYTFNISENYRTVGKFYGYAQVVDIGKPTRHIEINNDSTNIGTLNAIDDTVYNSIEDFHEGKTIAWGYIIKDKHPYSGEIKLWGFVFIPIKCSQNKINRELAAFNEVN